MTALLLAALLSASPAPGPNLTRTVAALERLERIQEAARRLDEAEIQLAAARTPRQRRAAWRAWFAARQALRTESGAR